jgi:hypothetical protein
MARTNACEFWANALFAVGSVIVAIRTARTFTDTGTEARELFEEALLSNAVAVIVYVPGVVGVQTTEKFGPAPAGLVPIRTLLTLNSTEVINAPVLGVALAVIVTELLGLASSAISPEGGFVIATFCGGAESPMP